MTQNDSVWLSLTQHDSEWLETTWNDSEWPTFFFNRYIVFFAPNFLFQASMAHLQNLRARNQDGSDFWKGSVDLTMMSKYVQRMSKVCFWPNDSESKQPCPCRVRRWSSSGYFGNTWNSGTFAESCLLLRRFQLWKVEGVRNLVEFGVLICFIVLHCALFWVKMRQLRITKFLEYKAIASKFPFCRVAFWQRFDRLETSQETWADEWDEIEREREREREWEWDCLCIRTWTSHESGWRLQCKFVFSAILKSFGEAQKEHDTVHSSKMLSVVSSTKPWSFGTIPPIPFSPWHHFATTVQFWVQTGVAWHW